MMINHSRVPITATHYDWKNKEYLRLGKGGYPESLTKGYWIERWDLKNEGLILAATAPYLGRIYMPIFKTGMARDLCNLRLWFLGIKYKIG